MKIEEVNKYIQLVKENGLGTLEIKSEEFEICIKMPQIIQNTVANTQNNNEVVENIISNISEDPSMGYEVKSPIVGIVYLQQEPGKPHFVSVGDTVKKGDKLCIISAMKVMNELISPVDGTVRNILIGNDEVVEFDQPLFVIE